MPKYWYDRMACKLPDDATEEEIEKREFNLRILADKKPYFMRYIYPQLDSQYTTYQKNTGIKCLREFRITIEELLATPEDELTVEQQNFVTNYKKRVPVGMHDCTMNRICWQVEKEFEGKPMLRSAGDDFDYSILKSGVEYTKTQYNAIAALYKQYCKQMQDFSQVSKKLRISEDEVFAHTETMFRYFKEECDKVCNNEETLCDIIVDLCYSRNTTKQFVWDMVGETIINNLLKHNDYTISFPVEDENGDIRYKGRRFLLKTVRSDVDE